MIAPTGSGEANCPYVRLQSIELRIVIETNKTTNDDNSKVSPVR